MNRLASILTLILFVHTASAYNPIWVIIDKKIIKNIVQLDRNNPQAVEEYFRTQKIQKCNTDKKNLGFGWTMWTPGIGEAISVYLRNSFTTMTASSVTALNQKCQRKRV